LHVVSVSPKRSVPPSRVPRLTRRPPQSAQFGQVYVPYPCAAQFCRQLPPVELRIVPRPRHGPHIHNALDPMRPQQIAEILPRACGMPDGENILRHGLSDPRAQVNSALNPTLQSCHRMSPFSGTVIQVPLFASTIRNTGAGSTWSPLKTAYGALLGVHSTKSLVIEGGSRHEVSCDQA